MNIKFCPIVSGSSGNSTYVGTDDTHILIDAGVSGIRIEKGLKSSANITGNEIDGIFVTHEHTDHICGVGVLSRRFDIPIYATTKTWEEMDRTNAIGDIKKHNRKTIYPDENIILNDMVLNPFSIPHDAVDPVGYTVEARDVKISVTTDLGHINDNIINHIMDSDILLIESNHDIEMLKNGPYPYYLKQRILSQDGHLSNVLAGELICHAFCDRLKHVYLGHLSKENNRPLIALDTVRTIVSANSKIMEKQLKIHLAERDYASELLEL